MRDQRYYQRLNQIRQKYGYLNDINPEQDMRQAPFKRESMPVSPHHTPINNYLNNYDIPLKNTQNEGRFDSQLSSKRHKENYPMTPLSNIKQQPPTDRSYRERQISQFQEDAARYNYERPRNERPSISESSQYADLPSQLTQNAENSSPIRKLQCELLNTPRQYANNERPSTMTPLKMNKNNYRPPNTSTTTERSPISKPYATQNFKQTAYTTKYGDRVSMTPDRTQKASINARRQQQNYKKRQTNPNQFDCGEDGAKYSTSINNIDKIQEKIQMALNKCKK